MNGDLVKTNCKSGFYLLNTYSWANNEGVFFSQIPPRSEAITPFYYWFLLICVCSWKKGRTFSFIERISLRTWRTLYFHEWVCYILGDPGAPWVSEDESFTDWQKLSYLEIYWMALPIIVFLWLIVHTICCFHWAIFFSLRFFPLPLLKKYWNSFLYR